MIHDIIEVRSNHSLPGKTPSMAHMEDVDIDGHTGCAVIDRKAALERTMGDEEFLSELLLEFTEWLAGIRERLSTAMVQNNADALSKEANLLAVAAGNLCAGGLSDAAFCLEIASRKGIVQEVHRSYRKLEQEIKSFVEHTRTD